MKTVLTGVKPTGVPHLGNYIGAIKPAIERSKKADRSYLFIADYHSLTSVHKGSELSEYTEQVAACWLACGLDPEKTVIYRQSDVPEIFELAWILSCHTPKGLINRAHAYKAKVQENKEAGREDLDHGVSMGLYYYPVLMASDVLLFSADEVPVGEDQVQHIEIARDIAQKFNRTYGEILKLPKFVTEIEKSIPGLDGRKMSKSYGNHIPLFMESKKLRKLVMKVVTDSTPPEEPKDPKASYIFQIYKELASQDKTKALQARYEKGIGWGEAKQVLFEEIESHFSEAKKVYEGLMNDRTQIHEILEQGALKAREAAAPLMEKVRKACRE